MSATFNSTFTASSSEGGPSYVSCIKVDGIPILPPLMTDERREEMRRYKQKAINKEKELKSSRISRLSTLTNTAAAPCTETDAKTVFIQSDPPSGEDFVTAPASPILRVPIPATSTPNQSEKVRVNLKFGLTTADQIQSLRGQLAEGPLASQILREQNLIRPTASDLAKRNVRYYNSGAKSHGDFIDVVNDDKNSSNCESTDTENQAMSSDDNRLTSSGSSTGTFIIDRQTTDGAATSRLLDESKNALERLTLTNKSDEEEKPGKKQDHGQTETPTRDAKAKNPSRRSNVDEPYFRRKRPAKYFDLDDDNEKENATTPDCIDSDDYDYANIPSTVPKSTSTQQAQPSNINHPMWFNFDPNRRVSPPKTFDSDFLLTLKALEASNNSQSPGTGDEKGTKHENKPLKTDAVTPENANTTKHVRKLSYTLETPSAALLEAVAKNQKFVMPLETVPSEAGSSRHQSVNSTPVKSDEKDHQQQQRNDETKMQSRAQANLSKRFEQERDTPLVSPESAAPIELLLRKMQEEHEKKLQELAERHRMQELQIRKEFESQMESFRSRLTSISASASDSDKSFSESITLPSSASAAAKSNNKSQQFLRPNTASSGISGINSARDDASISIAIASSSSSNARLFTASAPPAVGEPLVLATVGLSKLQGRMQHGRGSVLYRNPSDVRSPLLKGIVYPDPLEKSGKPVRIPMKAFEPEMKPKFDKISAAVKGYLTRRLLNTERVQIIVQTIRDTVDLLLKLYEEIPEETESGLFLQPQDTELHKRLVQQLNSACQSFHDVFFKLASKEKMAIIATDREKQRAKALKRLQSPVKHSITNATLRSIERRKSFQVSPKKRDNQRDHHRLRTSNASTYGSQSVNAKPVKNLISPKRRRISYWDGRSLGRSANNDFATNQNHHDLNGNATYKSVKPNTNSTQSRFRPSMGSSKNYQFSSMAGNTNGNGQQTFIITAPYTSNPSSSRSTRSSISSSSANNAALRYSRTSSSKQPWK